MAARWRPKFVRHRGHKVAQGLDFLARCSPVSPVVVEVVTAVRVTYLGMGGGCFILNIHMFSGKTLRYFVLVAVVGLLSVSAWASLILAET